MTDKDEIIYNFMISTRHILAQVATEFDSLSGVVIDGVQEIHDLSESFIACAEKSSNNDE